MKHKILLISGSPAQGSHTRAALQALESLLQQLNINTELVDLAQTNLPICNPLFHRDPLQHPCENVQKFIAQVSQSTAIVLGTPLYHGSFSGLLKNALDHLASDAFEGKAVGLLSNGAGIRACMLPCEQLRAVVRAMCGIATQSQIGTTKSDFVHDGTQLKLENADILGRIQRMAKELVSLSTGLEAMKLLED